MQPGYFVASDAPAAKGECGGLMGWTGWVAVVLGAVAVLGLGFAFWHTRQPGE